MLTPLGPAFLFIEKKTPDFLRTSHYILFLHRRNLLFYFFNVFHLVIPALLT